MALLEKFAFVDCSPIHSLDLHPDQKRFAIAQANDITIWKLLDTHQTHKPKTLVENVQVNLGKIVPKDFLLCRLQQHTKAVNCIRWSPDGKYLAAGSADNNVSIYHLVPGESMYKENWMCHKILRNHSSDVLAVAWSPKQGLMASASVDNTIAIYDTDTFEKIKTLTDHQSWVKAISFDPIGTFFASQSDKSIIFYSVNNWEKKFEVKDCFEKSTESSSCLRQSWSPEGGLFVAPGGFMSRKFIAPIFERNNLNHHVKDLVGHKGGIVVTKFNPTIFKGENGQVFSYVAIGGQEGTLSIWSTEDSKPKFISKHMFESGITDISWSNDGYGLLIASSMEKSLFHLVFPKEFLGQIIPKSEIEQQLMETYGDGNRGGFITEDVSMLEQVKPVVQKATAKITQATPQQVVVTEQKETIVKGGKRRITPVTVVSKPNPIDAMEVVSTPIQTSQPAPKRDVITMNYDTSTEPQFKKKKHDALHVSSRKRNEKTNIRLDTNSEIVVKEKEIEYKHLGSTVWKRVCKDALKFALHNDKFVILVCHSSVNIYSTEGISLLPPLQIDDPIVVALNKNGFFGVLSKNGMCNVWNLDEKSSFIQASAEFLDSHVDDMGLTDSGIPIITCSNGESYSWDFKLKCWICVAEVKTILTPYLASNLYGDEGEYTLNSLRQKAIRNYPNLFEGSQVQQAMDGFEFLERSMQSSISMQNGEEFVGFCKSYATLIARSGNFGRFEHLWRILIEDEPHKVGSIVKKDVVKEVFQIIASNKNMQRAIIDKKTQFKDL